MGLIKVKCRLNVVSSAKSSIVTTFRTKVPDHKNDSRVREGLNNLELDNGEKPIMWRMPTA